MRWVTWRASVNMTTGLRLSLYNFVPRTGKQYVRVKILANSFVYNQIRLMVGACVCAARGVLPEWVLRAALETPMHVYIPIAPPTGLALIDASFGRYRLRNIYFDSEAVRRVCLSVRTVRCCRGPATPNLPPPTGNAALYAVVCALRGRTIGKRAGRWSNRTW